MSEPSEKWSRHGSFAEAATAQSKHQPFKLDGVSDIEEIRVLGEWAYLWTKLSVVVVPTERAPIKVVPQYFAGALWLAPSRGSGSS